MAPAPVNLNLQHRVSNTIEEELEKLFQLLEKGEQILGNQKPPHEAIMVLGNTGSGKSTFTWWIADYDQLTSEKDPYTPGAFVITDPNGKISKDSTKSQTVFPDLVINNNTNAAYYDFAGFLDTRGAAYDIAITYFIKKVMDSVEKVKLIFVVNYNSVTGPADGDDFVKLVTHATSFVKHTEKFENCTTLVVSKVPKSLSYFPDHDIVESVGNFITKAREQLVDNLNALHFVDRLLQKNGDLYPHIWLSGLRGINRTGLLNNMPQVQERKYKMQAALKKIDYVKSTDNDFGYSVPKQSLADAHTMIKSMNKRVFTSLASFGEEICKYLYNEELKLYDLVALYNQTIPMYNKLIETKKKANSYDLEPEKCVREISDNLNFINSNIAHESLSNATKNADYSSFLHTVSGINVPFKCADGLNNAIEYASKSQRWYKFLIDLYNNALVTYEVQRNIASSTCNSLAKFVIQSKDIENKQSNILEKYVKYCSPQYDFQTVANITMDKPKLIALRSLLNSTMNYKLDSWCESNNQFTIRGQYVKLSDILGNDNCHNPPKSIKIFALDRVFINEDLEQIGEVQISIIAPIWDVLGKRKLVLQGESGESHKPPKAPNGQVASSAGKDGDPGLPGGPGGNFLGIGDKFYNLADFVLSLIGGSGGPGQNGGDGAAGTNGDDAFNDIKLNSDKYPKESSAHKIRNYTSTFSFCPAYFSKCRTTESYILAGYDGGKGGDGGNGGKEGKGASPGNYIFWPTSSNGINLKIKKNVGPDGLQGNGGLGGLGGKNGRDMRVEISLKKWFGGEDTVEYTYLLGNRGWASSGKYGGKGANSKARKNPKEPVTMSNTSNIVNEYKVYLRENLFHSVRGYELRDFLNKLDSLNINIQNQPRQCLSADLNLDQGLLMPTSQSTNSTISEKVKRILKSSLSTAFNLVHNFSTPFGYSHTTIKNAGLPLKSSSPSSLTSQSKYENSFATLLGPGHTSESPLVTLDRVDTNSSLAFADFLVRCITKVKPYNGTGYSTNFSEIKAYTLNIMTEFEKILTNVATELNNLPKHQSMEFDPIVLMSKLDRELTNQNYQKISKILYLSIENKDGLDYNHFQNYMQPKINQVLAGQEEENFYNTCVHNENHQINNFHIGIGAKSNFKHIGDKMEEKYGLK